MMGTDFHIDSYGRNGKGHSGYTALLSSVQHGNYDDVLTLPISISQIVASALGRSVENSVISKNEEEELFMNHIKAQQK